MFKLDVKKELSPYTDETIYTMAIRHETYYNQQVFTIIPNYSQNQSLETQLEQLKKSMCADIMSLKIPKEYLFNEDLHNILED